jgi:hypothetical protein
MLYPGMVCVLRVSLCTAHSTPRNFTDCFNISVTLARLKCKLPDDGRRPKRRSNFNISFNVNFRVF